MMEEFEKKTYALGFQMCASQAVVVLVEVHHLESVELVRDLFDLLCLTRLDDFHTLCVPTFLSMFNENPCYLQRTI